MNNNYKNMKKLHPKYLFSTYLILSQLENLVQTTPPFCQTCSCHHQFDETLKITCDQQNLDLIYQNTFWYDSSNNPYPITSLTIKSTNFTSLNTQFPQSNLTSLDLSNNSISKIGNGILRNLQQMKTLILGRNQLESIKPDVFQVQGVYVKDEYFPLKSLRSLDLSHNKLKTLDADVFEHIDELDELRLDHNPFQVVDAPTLSAITSLVNLKVLDLSYTQLKTLPEYFMHTAKYLSKLNLTGNNFEAVPKTLEQSHSLEVLYFNNNPVRNLSGFKLVPNSVFPKIVTLRVLQMSEMPVLEDIGAHGLSGLENLQELDVSYNTRLKYIDPDWLSRLEESIDAKPPLKKVHMMHNNLSTLDQRVLLDLHQLADLDLGGNPWRCDCLNQGLVDGFIPVYIKFNRIQAQQLKCQNPIEMMGVTFYDLNQNKSLLRCDGRHGYGLGRNGFLLIGTISGVLTGILLVMVLVYLYRVKRLNRGVYSWPNSSQPHYSRV